LDFPENSNGFPGKTNVLPRKLECASLERRMHFPENSNDFPENSNGDIRGVLGLKVLIIPKRMISRSQNRLLSLRVCNTFPQKLERASLETRTVSLRRRTDFPEKTNALLWEVKLCP
jgi:hypothetical protein